MYLTTLKKQNHFFYSFTLKKLNKLYLLSGFCRKQRQGWSSTTALASNRSSPADLVLVAPSTSGELVVNEKLCSWEQLSEFVLSTFLPAHLFSFFPPASSFVWKLKSSLWCHGVKLLPPPHPGDESLTSLLACWSSQALGGFIILSGVFTQTINVQVFPQEASVLSINIFFSLYFVFIITDFGECNCEVPPRSTLVCCGKTEALDHN